MKEKEYILQCESLTKVYGTQDNLVTACNEINLKFEKEKVYSIVGPSGSGKSTLLHLLGGLEKPTSGKVIYREENIFSMHEMQLASYRRRNCGFVFQNFQLLPELTVKENIMIPLLLDKKRESKEFFDELTNWLGISDKLECKPNQLSGGQQQRVAIARALIHSPEIVFCDEPTGNLDRKNGIEVMKLLDSINQNFHTTIIIVTHDHNIASQTDKVIQIMDGKLKCPVS